MSHCARRGKSRFLGIFGSEDPPHIQFIHYSVLVLHFAGKIFLPSLRYLSILYYFQKNYKCRNLINNTENSEVTILQEIKHTMFGC